MLGLPPGYNVEGFLAVQIAIERAFIAMSSNRESTTLPEIHLQRYPYPEFVEDQLLTFLQFFIPFFIIISFFYVCINNIKVNYLKLQICLVIYGIFLISVHYC